MNLYISSQFSGNQQRAISVNIPRHRVIEVPGPMIRLLASSSPMTRPRVQPPHDGVSKTGAANDANVTSPGAQANHKNKAVSLASPQPDGSGRKEAEGYACIRQPRDK